LEMLLAIAAGGGYHYRKSEMNIGLFTRSGQRAAHLVETFRGEALLIAATGRISVACEVSKYRAEGKCWQSGSISGDLRGILESGEQHSVELCLPNDRRLHVALDDIDEDGATFEELVQPSPRSPAQRN
jgi:hypothetical protein